MGSVTRVLAVANQKGGVAKTTTVASLGAAMVELDKRVLLVDLDVSAAMQQARLPSNTELVERGLIDVVEPIKIYY